MAVLAFIRCDHNGRIFRGSFHSFLHCASAICAPIIAPRIWAVLHGLLSILPPAVAILKIVDLALGHECKARLPNPLLALPPDLIRCCLGRRRLAPGAPGPLRRILARARVRRVRRRRLPAGRRRIGAPESDAATGRGGSRRIEGPADGPVGRRGARLVVVGVEVPSELAEDAALGGGGGGGGAEAEEVDAVGGVGAEVRPAGASGEIGPRFWRPVVVVVHDYHFIRGAIGG